jgi:hypothetical protein
MVAAAPHRQWYGPFKPLSCRSPHQPKIIHYVSVYIKPDEIGGMDPPSEINVRNNGAMEFGRI